MFLAKLIAVNITRFHDGALSVGMINPYVRLGSRIPLEDRNPVNDSYMSLTSENILPKSFPYYKCSDIPLNVVQDFYQETLEGRLNEAG